MFAHPFGRDVCRERNIKLKQRVAYLSDTTPLTNTRLLADFMVDQCVNPHPESRPTTSGLLAHPLLWDFAKQLAFLEKIFNDTKAGFENDNLVKSLEADWQKYNQGPYSSRVPEAWAYHVYCKKLDKKPKPSDKSLFNGLLRNMRNLHQHCEEAMGRFTVRSERGRTLGEVLGAGSDEEIGRYFLEAIPELIPIVYLGCWEHFYNNYRLCMAGSLTQFYCHPAARDVAHVKGMVSAGKSTLNKLLTGSRERQRSKSRSGPSTPGSKSSSSDREGTFRVPGHSRSHSADTGSRGRGK